MAAPNLDDILDRLYAAPLTEFVKLRNETVKELRAAGRREDAAQIKALRKPSTSAWVVNQLSYRSPGDLEALSEADEALRDAHGGAGSTLQQAVQERRRCLDRLVEEARTVLIDSGGSATREQMRRIAATLEASTAAGSEVRPGRLVEDLEVAGFGALAGLTIAPVSVAPKKAASKGSEKRAARPAKKKPRPAPSVAPPEEDRAEAERATLRIEEAKLERAEREATRAETEHLAALRRIDRAQGKIDELDERLAAARAGLEAAREDGVAKSTELDEAREAVKRALKRVEAARESLQGLSRNV